MTPRPDAPLSTAAIRDDFPEIVAEVRARLEAGKLTYGDDSFERPLAEVVAELRQEALDIIGWGFILCARVKHLERLALEATTPHRPTADGPRVPITMSWPGMRVEIGSASVPVPDATGG